jgi:L-rhamnose mutarotase
VRRYCTVYELKEEHIKDYSDLHRKAHLSEWKPQLEALKQAGAENCMVYIYKNLAIMFYECEDIDVSFTELGNIEINQKWQAYEASWFKDTPKFDGSEVTISLEKIFDLNQQLEGFLDQY